MQDFELNIPDPVPELPLTEDETIRRMPAVDLLPDELRTPVIEITRRAPDYFWEVRATSSQHVDYHHPICRRNRGLWAHTLMQFGPLLRLAESQIAMDRITEQERDYAIAACILHDQRKRGEHGNPEEFATSDHDLHMAEVVESCGLPEPISDAIASHMGPSEWGYDGPEPETPLEFLVHNADMMASTPNADIHVPGPVPKELEVLGLEEGDFDL